MHDYLKELTSSLSSRTKSDTISYYDLLENNNDMQLANVTMFSNDDHCVDNNVNNNGEDLIILQELILQ